MPKGEHSIHDIERNGVTDACAHTSRVSFNRHLLIDGANILHAWPEIAAVLRRDGDAARAQLILRAAAIHDEEAMRVTVVFDGRGEDIAVEHPSKQASLSVVFTPTGVTADTVIERMVGRSADPANCVVATDDRAERETVIAAGATAISASELIAWIERVESRRAAALKALRRSNDTRWKNQ